jgi:hypothetical protein
MAQLHDHPAIEFRQRRPAYEVSRLQGCPQCGAHGPARKETADRSAPGPGAYRRTRRCLF